MIFFIFYLHEMQEKCLNIKMCTKVDNENKYISMNSRHFLLNCNQFLTEQQFFWTLLDHLDQCAVAEGVDFLFLSSVVGSLRSVRLNGVPLAKFCDAN